MRASWSRPGNAFGPGGDGFFRVSLIADVAGAHAAIERLRDGGHSVRPTAPESLARLLHSLVDDLVGECSDERRPRRPTGETPIDSDPRMRTPPQPKPELPDPDDEIPVPGAMTAAEIDERAQVVEKLRRDRGIDTGDSRVEP